MTEKNYKVESYDNLKGGRMITVSLGRVELELHDDGVAYIAEQNEHNKEWRVVKIKISELESMIDIAKKELDEVMEEVNQ